eukprot:SAG31_NODE_33055_length_348_cov_1.024096_1_plen_52_part_10
MHMLPPRQIGKQRLVEAVRNFGTLDRNVLNLVGSVPITAVLTCGNLLTNYVH